MATDDEQAQHLEEIRVEVAGKKAGAQSQLAEAAKEAPKGDVDASVVQELEWTQHILKGRTHDGIGEHSPRLGLALSGGGIRSATFGLGVLQALHSLNLFKQIDYVSTVSGGGYIGGWLQGAKARGVLERALTLTCGGGVTPTRAVSTAKDAAEPREVRFLRAYSNYLTPRLGLFSGDTWAAVGNSLRNLILNFTILSLSLLTPLYLPWLAALLFWRLTPQPTATFWTLVAAGVLLAVSVATSASNMAHPLKGGKWTRSGASRARPWQVTLLVVVPSLLAMGLVGTMAWRRAHAEWTITSDRGADILWGGVIYAAIWIAGLAFGYAIGLIRARLEKRVPAADSPKPDFLRAFRFAVYLTACAFVAGVVGWAVLETSVIQIAGWAETGQQAWAAALLTFPVSVLSLLVAITVHIGLAGNLLSDETREWWGRVGGIQLLMTLILVGLGVLALAGPRLPDGIFAVLNWLGIGTFETFFKWFLGGLWALVTGAGLLAGKSERTSTGQGPRLLEAVGRVAPAVFVIGYLLFLSILLYRTVPFAAPAPGPSSWLPLRMAYVSDVEDTLRARAVTVEASVIASPGAGAGAARPSAAGDDGASQAAGLLFTLVVVGTLAFVISWRVDLNEFSLHALYRNRLVRCYLGASNNERSAHPFTGFDPNDDRPLAPHADENQRGLPGPIRPYPIFNVALNLVGGKNLAWQQRKAASFIFTPEYCGFEFPVTEESERDERKRSAYAKTATHASDPSTLTVGLAVATSGAAASPNMGYHSSPTLAFLMTVFNVRLGWWLRNPRWTEVWTNAHTGLSLREFLYELLGMTTDDRSWVYLSDGGHFENLGIYELVRRRCRFIIACDAGQDGGVTFEDLGNAIEKCRADFGVDIQIDLSGIRPHGTKLSERHCAIGTIRYDSQNPREAAGTLLYIKSSLTGDEPADVLRYASLNADFPHQSTADQNFDESQFESYRALGYHVGCTVLSAATEAAELATLSTMELFTRLRQHWALPAPAPPDAVTKYSTALRRIWATVRATDALQFLDRQMFPEWPSLMSEAGLPDPAKVAAQAEGRWPEMPYWLPGQASERRAGFYLCSEMLQLMEDVYLEFQLDDNYSHIDNRGWMNLFQHWSWSGMLCATWAITGSTYDPRFQRFCQRRLDLWPGRPYVAGGDDWIQLPSASEWEKLKESERAQYKVRWQSDGRFNYWEVELVARFLSGSTAAQGLQLVPLRVLVESPRRTDKNPLDFNVGYLIADIDWDAKRFRLYHMRVQNHLRKMGLARAALAMITLPPDDGWGMKLEVIEPETPGTSEGNSMAEAVPSAASLLSVQSIVKSLPRSERTTGPSPGVPTR